MKKKLTLLVVLSAVALCGIIILQGVWLRNAYLEQQKAFITEVKSALSEVREQEKEALLKGKPRVAQTSAKGMDTVIVIKADSLLPEMEGQNSGTDININTNALLRSISHISSVFSAEVYKKRIAIDRQLMKEALARRDIDIPFELAFYDFDGKFYVSTVSKDSFMALPIKITPPLLTMNDASFTASNDSSAQLNISIFEKQLYVGFDNAGGHAFRKMSGILALSLVLILVHIVAFVLMVRMFVRQKRLSEVRSGFMSNMTHELKTPISSVSLALELLQAQATEKGSSAAYIQAAQSELGRLTKMVNWVLDMSAFEERKITLTFSRHILMPWTEEIVASFVPVLDQRNARLDVSVAPPDLAADIDNIHLNNVIRNLVDNSIKYNRSLQPVVGIAITQPDAETVQIRITDNGIGIDEKYQRQVFEQFFRVPTGDVHDVKGFGLGLSYVKTIVHLHKGSIELQSEPGKGTVFTIRIPKTRKA